MTWPTLIWGAPRWGGPALALGVVAALMLLWGYLRAPARGPLRLACAGLKAAGLTALLVSLAEPLLTGSRPKRGANAFVVLADNSRSLSIRDEGARATRGDWLRDALRDDAPWRARLAQDFDVRTFVFDTHTRPVAGFDGLAFDGEATALTGALDSIARRFHGLPLAGVLLLTDGNRTDAGDPDWTRLAPVYPVVPPTRPVRKDIGVEAVSVSQTSFEAAPVEVRADVAATGFEGEELIAAVTDETGQELDRQRVKALAGGTRSPLRFQLRPERRGVHFFTVNAFAAANESRHDGKDDHDSSGEPTLENNRRLVVVDQGGGPYRVLYVGGRPNWEYKFLRRAEADDEQVQFVGLLRIARKQPRFDFRDARSGPTSALFEGFDHPDPDSAERADQPVLVRLGTRDEAELRDGFPKTAEELYAYHAVVLDDVEAAFFTQDQLALLRSFVSQRGGGFLMLGGPDSFAEGRYDRTPVGDILPVYVNHAAEEGPLTSCRLVLTREGWLQPWVRTRKTEDDEQRRLASMPAFQVLSQTGAIKPGAVVLAEARDEAGKVAPALVAQRFGKGHVGALLVGDLWRWGLRRSGPTASDLERSWRQTVRWLVADVPERVEVTIRPRANAAAPAVEVAVRVRDAAYRALDDAKVSIHVVRPGGETFDVEADPDGHEAGAYTATIATRTPGPYRITASATAPDGSAVGQREAGWAAQPAADEFARLGPDRALLDTIAAKTRGQVVEGARLDDFIASLSARGAPITERWSAPFWHQPLFFLFAIVCLVAEWGLRRTNGLA